MVKAKAHTSKGDMMILGLSDENLRRLKNGEPIKFNMEAIGMGKCDVLIFHGKTEQHMRTMMKDI